MKTYCFEASGRKLNQKRSFAIESETLPPHHQICDEAKRSLSSAKTYRLVRIEEMVMVKKVTNICEGDELSEEMPVSQTTLRRAEDIWEIFNALPDKEKISVLHNALLHMHQYNGQSRAECIMRAMGHSSLK